MFIENLFNDPQYYFMVVISVMVSIVLHELAHGWAAIRLGDRTPLDQHRMTPNPLVHMGGMSLAMLALVGIAWGQMPVNPHRLRGRYASALVAAAGPACNLLLALLSLTVLSVWIRMGPSSEDQFTDNALRLLELFGLFNIVLCLFNLVPIPPLDGSKILANFSRDFQRALEDPDRQGQFFIAFLIGFFFLSRYLFKGAGFLAESYCRWIIGL